MRRRLRLLVLFLLQVALAASAQSVLSLSPRSFPLGVIPLSGQWRTHAGDDLAWASPGFDDSSWQTTDLADAVVQPGWHWYRLRIQVSAQTPPLALLLDAPVGSSEVWIDGRAVPGLQISPFWKTARNRLRLIPLPSASKPIEVALRVFYSKTTDEMWRKSALRVLLGGIREARATVESDTDRRFVGLLPSGLINLAFVLAGFGSLVLFFSQPSRHEYLWLGLYLIIYGSGGFTFVAVSNAALPYWVNDLLSDPLVYPLLIVQIEFTYAFIGRSVGRTWRMCQMALLAMIPFAYLAWTGLVSGRAYLMTEVLASLIVATGLPALLFIHFWRGNREAGLLVLASLLPAASIGAGDLSPLGQFFGWRRLASFYIAGPAFGPITLGWTDLAGLVFLLAIGALMFRRFNRVSAEQARTAAELDSAREIQQRLVPLTLPTVPGFRIGSAYLPAEEVGGDFYQVLEQTGGATLIVIGDVSGKGLKAAMTGALVLGALRNMTQENLSPSRILFRLNSQLASSSDGGFVTCLCIHIAPDGTLTVANAGHLPPWRNGEEVPLESSLPLGITADTTYPESNLHLNPGDTLTFLSDGVVEAQSATGELFGFDRTRSISTQTAEAIAHAAQDFGQQDDITVLTLQFAPAEVAHA